jgi:hypothetical protein
LNFENQVRSANEFPPISCGVLMGLQQELEVRACTALSSVDISSYG